MGLHLLLTAWTFDPLTIISLVVLLGGYLYAVGPLRQRLAAQANSVRAESAEHAGQQGDDDVPGEPPQAAGAGESLADYPTRKMAYFVAGWALLAFTLISPLDAIGRLYLFSAHTFQLFLIITVIAPLLMLGIPDWLTARLIPSASARRATEGLMFQVVAVVLFNGIILIWHITPLYEAALRNMTLHALQMLSFLVAGVLTWWPLLTPTTRRIRMSSPAQILYLVLESLPLDFFGVAALFTSFVFYPVYAQAPRVFGLTALADQQIAGGILAAPGNMIDLVLMSIIFFSWIAQMERAQIAREREQYAREDAEQAEAEAASQRSPAGR